MDAPAMIRKAISVVPLAAERLTRAGDALGELLFYSLADERIAPAACLSVQVEGGGISLAYGSRFLSRLKIEGTRHYPLDAGKYPSPEVLASTVHLALSDLKAMKADITLIVPKAWTIMRTADFPAVVKDTLSDVVSYELDRLTPLSSEKAYYDYQIIREDENRLQIILAALKAETLDPYLHALLQKGIQVRRVIVSLSALGALSRHVQGGKSVLFLDARPGWYEGGLLDEGRLSAFFTGSFPSEAEPEKTRLIAAEINPLVEVLKKGGKTPAVVVNGRSGSWPLLSEQVQAPIRFLGETDLKLDVLRREAAIPPVALGGVLESLRTALRGLNLLDKGVHKPSRTPRALTIFLIVALGALGLFFLAASLQIETKKVEAVEREIAARSNEVRRIEALKKEEAALEKEISTVEQFKTTRPMVLNLFKELTLILPKNAWLTRVRSTDTTVDIEGYAASATDILAKLEASRYFQKVEFASPTFRDARMNADRFVIKMEIEGLSRARGKDAKQ